MKCLAFHACLGILLQSISIGQESGVTHSLELGQATGHPGGEIEIPLELSTTAEVQGVQAVFEWDGTAGTGVNLIVDPEIVAAAEFATFHLADDWMAVGIVTLASPLIGAGIPLVTAIIQCNAGQIDTTTPVVFRDGVHRVDLLLSNVVTVDLGRSVRQADGLQLIDGSFRCVPPPCPVQDVVCTSAEGVVEVSWSLGEGANCRSLAIEVRAGDVTLLLPPEATAASIPCTSLAPTGTLSVVSLGVEGREESAVCDYACRSFSRGDGNDDGVLDISDVVTVLSCLFQGLFCPQCLDAADCNDDGRIDTSDAVCVLSCLFGVGVCSAEPFPGCGFDMTIDAIGCAEYASCL